MKLQIMISGVIVETVEIRLYDKKSYLERRGAVEDKVNYLKLKYQVEIDYKEWRIDLIVSSKIHKVVENDTNDVENFTNIVYETL